MLVMYPLDAVVPRSVLKGNKAIGSIYRDFGTCGIGLLFAIYVADFGVKWAV